MAPVRRPSTARQVVNLDGGQSAPVSGPYAIGETSEVPAHPPGPPSPLPIGLSMAFMGMGDGDGDGAIVPGPPGQSGAAGAQGPVGPAGPIGLGIDGMDGNDGLTIPGAVGPTGPPGINGNQGPQGPWGEEGAEGPEGMAIPGPIGSTGPQGNTGPAGSSNVFPFPQGRLSLVSAVAVMTSDQTAKGTIYYVEFCGNQCPVYNGSGISVLTFSNLSLILDTSNFLSGSVYDVFLYDSGGGVAAIGGGPAWTSTTARGTGAGTTELQLISGLWSNKNSITLHNNSASSGAISANRATYLGSFYCTANGLTGMAFQPTATVGGTNNILGVFNAYNRVSVTAMSRDSTVTWTYGSNTPRAANASNSNRISFVDGLAVSAISGSWQVLGTGSGTIYGVSGMNLDSTSATPQVFIQVQNALAGAAHVLDSWPPQTGFHFVQAIEAVNGGTYTFYGALSSNVTRQSNALQVTLEM